MSWSACHSGLKVGGGGGGGGHSDMKWMATDVLCESWAGFTSWKTGSGRRKVIEIKSDMAKQNNNILE